MPFLSKRANSLPKGEFGGRFASSQQTPTTLRMIDDSSQKNNGSTVPRYTYFITEQSFAWRQMLWISGSAYGWCCTAVSLPWVCGSILAVWMWTLTCCFVWIYFLSLYWGFISNIPKPQHCTVDYLIILCFGFALIEVARPELNSLIGMHKLLLILTQ